MAAVHGTRRTITASSSAGVRVRTPCALPRRSCPATAPVRATRRTRASPVESAPSSYSAAMTSARAFIASVPYPLRRCTAIVATASTYPVDQRTGRRCRARRPTTAACAHDDVAGNDRVRDCRPERGVASRLRRSPRRTRRSASSGAPTVAADRARRCERSRHRRNPRAASRQHRATRWRHSFGAALRAVRSEPCVRSIVNRLWSSYRCPLRCPSLPPALPESCSSRNLRAPRGVLVLGQQRQQAVWPRAVCACALGSIVFFAFTGLARADVVPAGVWARPVDGGRASARRHPPRPIRAGHLGVDFHTAPGTPCGPRARAR